jgi:hypothetical protein
MNRGQLAELLARPSPMPMRADRPRVAKDWAVVQVDPWPAADPRDRSVPFSAAWLPAISRVEHHKLR